MEYPINALTAGRTYMIAERFEKAVKLIRSALAETELSIAGELDVTEIFGGKKAERSRILLVDCPVLVFEALALDRSAGVFFPQHVLVRADGERTQVSTVSAAGLFDVRLPLGAAYPIARLQAHVTLALESVWLRAGGNQQGKGK